MRILLGQLEKSLEGHLYYLSLITALAVPDIAGALDAEDGQATGERYRSWYERWVRPRFGETIKKLLAGEVAPLNIPVETNPLDGDACYRFRCSLLHQGSSQHPKSQYSRIVFIEPGSALGSIHYCIMNDALCIDLGQFCREMISGARLWLDDVETSEPFRTIYDRFARRHATGLPPFIANVPVIG
jgi:hypothetical protein